MQIQSSGYTIYYGNTVFSQLAQFLTNQYNGKPIVILVDENTFELCLPELISQVPMLGEADVIEIPAGEVNKSIENIAHIWESLTGLGLDRDTLLINLGGGMVSDMGGFAASTFKRGIRFINLPTSLLAMVDASVGGKTGFDFNGIKNHIGLFSNPDAVFISPTFLSTLPKRELLAGFAEMLKHALIADAVMWDRLKNLNVENLDELATLLPESISIKNSLVLADPFDKADRRKLNFGHTVGHAFESTFLDSDEPMLHGESVAVGMVCEAFLSVEKGLLGIEALKEIEQVVERYFKFPELTSEDEVFITAFIEQDKKNSNSTINASLLTGIGQCAVDVAITDEEIKKALHYCKALSY